MPPSVPSSGEGATSLPLRSVARRQGQEAMASAGTQVQARHPQVSTGRRGSLETTREVVFVNALTMCR